MTLLPVIDRELRVQARLWFTYLLRVLGAISLLVVCLFFWARVGSSSTQGAQLFGHLNCMLFVAIWMIVPFLTADCISRERREGTLALLFLTPLTVYEIVLSKGLAHGLRALTLWLATLPVLTISFLMGGVTWKEAVLSVMVHFSSICWSLSAGLVASSVAKTWARAMILSGGVAGCFAFGLMLLTGVQLLLVPGLPASTKFPFPFQYAMTSGRRIWSENILQTGFLGVTDFDAWWGTMLGSLSATGQRHWLEAQVMVAFMSVAFLLAMAAFAAWSIRRVWQEEPPSARQVWLEQTFTRPIVGVAYFKRWLTRKLESNPMGWLQQRTWGGRMVAWGWFAVMISFYSAVFSTRNIHLLLPGVQLLMAWGLMTLIAANAAGSFQRERETKVMEILLVSPMSEQEIIYGRLRGLWGQFLPSMLLLFFVWCYLPEIFHLNNQKGLSFVVLFCSSYLAVPVVGLYYSLKRGNFITSFLSTILMCFLVPYGINLTLQMICTFLFYSSGTLLDPLLQPLLEYVGSNYLLTLLQLGIGWATLGRLQRDLIHRRFRL